MSYCNTAIEKTRGKVHVDISTAKRSQKKSFFTRRCRARRCEGRAIKVRLSSFTGMWRDTEPRKGRHWGTWSCPARFKERVYVQGNSPSAGSCTFLELAVLRRRDNPDVKGILVNLTNLQRLFWPLAAQRPGQNRGLTILQIRQSAARRDEDDDARRRLTAGKPTKFWVRANSLSLNRCYGSNQNLSN